MGHRWPDPTVLSSFRLLPTVVVLASAVCTNAQADSYYYGTDYSTYDPGKAAAQAWLSVVCCCSAWVWFSGA